MARASGKAGSVTINAVTYNGVKNWEINYKGDAVDVTGMSDSGAKNFVGGLTEWSGSCSINWDVTQAPPAPGAAYAATFLTGAGGSYDSFAGTILATDIHVSTPVDGAVTLDITFQGTGALTIS